jgi:hypothetical protein
MANPLTPEQLTELKAQQQAELQKQVFAGSHSFAETVGTVLMDGGERIAVDPETLKPLPNPDVDEDIKLVEKIVPSKFATPKTEPQELNTNG